MFRMECTSDMEQRHGRIIRQGNTNTKVDIYRYTTDKTFDAYLYQMFENKQKFISQIMTDKSPVRSCDDVDEIAILRYKSTKSITKNVMLFVSFINKQYLASDKENDCINLTNILLSRFLYYPYGCRKYQNPFSCSSMPHGIFPACQKLCL